MGTVGQQERIAFNNRTQRHIAELKTALSDSNAARARFENSLHEERQEHRMCNEALNHERLRHNEMEKNLEYAWGVNSKLDEITREVQYRLTNPETEGKEQPSFDITGLILDNESRAQTVSTLEESLQRQEENSKTEIAQLERKLQEESIQRAADVRARDEFIVQLEDRLHEIENIEDQTLQLDGSQKQSRRRRQAGRRTRSKRGDSVPKQCNDGTEKHNRPSLKVESGRK